MNKYQSPLITCFLDSILPSDLHHLIGDLEEEFHQNKADYGKTRAHLYLWSQIFRTFPWFLFQSLTWNTVMITNYLKVTWRNIRKHKSFSIINISGLAVSMAVCLLIILFIYDQKNYDQFHTQKARIFRVITDYKSSASNTSEWFATSPVSLSTLLEEQYAGIERAISVRATFGGETKYRDDIILPIQGLFADSDFLQVFDFKLIKGNPATALLEPGTIILTESAASNFFDDENPIGKTLEVLGDRTYTVTGIVEDKVQTHFSFEVLASNATLQGGSEKPELSDWTQGFSNSYTYVLLNKNVDPNRFKEQLTSTIPTHYPELDKSSIQNFDMQPLTNINLGRVLANEIGTVMPAVVGYFLGGFALIIVLIACFNYVSLMIARSLTRGKEVGVRKVLGAFRSSLIKQFIVEAIIIALLALILASVILRWLLPEFNSLYLINIAESQIGLNFQSDYFIYLLFIGFSVLIGIMAGFYPALYLSRFKPAKVLKGINNIRGFSALTLRKIIIVGQFSFSIIFIITSILLFRQFSYMVETDYGFNREHIIHVALQDIPYERFRSTIQSNPAVQQIAATSKVPALGSITGMWLKSDSTAERIRANSFKVDENYMDLMGLKLVAGRNFNPEYGSDPFSSAIINKSAIEALNLVNPQQALGAPILVEDSAYRLIGVVENFVSSSPLQNDEPAIILNNPENFYYAAVKTHPETMQHFLPYLKETWYKLDSKYPVQYQIFDEQLQNNPIVAVFGDFIKILGVVTAFTILISCLGLFGMAIYTSENRIKEIGIRKVMGATISDIILLLSKDYLMLIGIAALIGGPTAWFLNQLWLQNISNKIEVGIGIFLLGILGTTLLALMTIGSQTIRAARANSVENLQNE